jgi:thioredoxin 1
LGLRPVLKERNKMIFYTQNMSSHNHSTEFTVKGGSEEIYRIAARHPKDILLLDFQAKWCGPCRSLAPKLHALVEQLNGQVRSEHPKLILCNVDVDDNDDAANSYVVSALPTLVWISNMNIMGRTQGADIKTIEQTSRKILGL